MRLGLFMLGLASAPATPARADAPAYQDIERQVQKVAAATQSGVVALVVSHHPRHPLPPDADRPLGKLGTYPVPGDLKPDPKLDLADPRTAADFTTGSGVVLDAAAGLVLTNYHLIDGGRRVYVRTAAGRGSYADIHAADARADLAVLKLITPPAGLTAVPIADARTVDGLGGARATVGPGTLIVTVGHPDAAAAADGVPLVSWGTLTGVRRRTPAGPLTITEDTPTKPLHQYAGLLKTDARATVGCSGAAILNMAGELIGLATPTAALTGADSAGGYALPMDPNFRRIVAVLKAGREVEYGFLGVQMPRGGVQVGNGLTLPGVTPGGPAAVAGLAAGDVILAVDGNLISEADDLFLYVGAALAGSEVTLAVGRGSGFGVSRPVKAMLAKFDHKMDRIVTARPPAVHGLRVDWASVYYQQHTPRFMPAGVVVSEVAPGSPAAAKLAPLGGPGAAWLVTRVADKAVLTPREFYAVAGGPDQVKLTVIDLARPGGVEHEVTLP